MPGDCIGVAAKGMFVAGQPSSVKRPASSKHSGSSTQKRILPGASELLSKSIMALQVSMVCPISESASEIAVGDMFGELEGTDVDLATSRTWTTM
mmetsp:Transcript_36009/g.91672  ORF Transcript_36009/g.91672 Transcript_36009/m.91672 type:complete len:95 (-) Transcript_36009:1024-1308(-)